MVLFSIEFCCDVKALRKRFDPVIPVVVHCSAGVGRSGVLVLVDMLMERYDAGQVSFITIHTCYLTYIHLWTVLIQCIQIKMNLCYYSECYCFTVRKLLV